MSCEDLDLNSVTPEELQEHAADHRERAAMVSTRPGLDLEAAAFHGRQAARLEALYAKKYCADLFKDRFQRLKGRKEAGVTK